LEFKKKLDSWGTESEAGKQDDDQDVVFSLEKKVDIAPES
jgi:hypothetical protein